MEQKHLNSKNNKEFDMIPALLTPDNITKNKEKNYTESNTYIDTIDIDENYPSDMVIRERLHYALELEHIDLFMQPIMTLPQRHITFYEFFSRLRIRAGQYIPAQNYLKLADEDHITSNIDALFLTQCLKILKRQKNKVSRFTSYFINIKPYTLKDKNFMRRLVDILSKHKDISYRLIFEMNMHDFLMLSPAEKKILKELSKVKCRFSIDHVTDIPQNIESLRDLNVRFIKINANILIKKGQSEEGLAQVLNQKQRLEDYNINLVVDKIEREAELIELLDYDIKYGQGFLFGKPDFAGVYT